MLQLPKMSLAAIVVIAAFFPIASVLALQLGNLDAQLLALTVPSDPNDIPAGWTFVGCFSDSTFQTRTLLQAEAVNPAMTPLLCTEFCSGSPGPFNFAGTEFSEQCFCGFDIEPTAELLPNSSCNFPCEGDANLMCGGPDTISVYQNLNLKFIPPTNKPVVNNWTFGGCFIDNPTNGRSLTVSVCMSEEVNVEGCTATCQEVGFTIAGLEFGSECWCGDSFVVPTAAAPVTDCDMPCDGDDTEFCGGPDRLTIYTLTS